MQRLAALTQISPLKLVSALFALALASTIAVGSGASFTSSSANPSNLHTAGDLSHVNSKAAAAILTADRMKPGDVKTGTVAITNDGDIDGVFSLATSGLSDTPGPGAGVLSGKLTLEIRDQGDPAAPASPGTLVYSGALSGVGTKALGTFAPDEARQYSFKVTFPDTGTGAENAFKASSASIQFDWTSTETG